MINTKLPYDFDDMEKIEEDGAIVDMSNPCYPECDDIERTSLIYLRNTNFPNVQLDFSNVPFASKEKYLIKYLTEDIVYNIKEFVDTWVKLFLNYKGLAIEMPSILSKQEQDDFIENNRQLIAELDSFAFSLLLYPISRLDTDDFVFDFNDITKTEFEFSMNVCFLIEHSCWNLIYEFHPSHEPQFYEKLFTKENNVLFETIMKYTPFSVLLYGINNREEWKEFSNEIKHFMENRYA